MARQSNQAGIERTTTPGRDSSWAYRANRTKLGLKVRSGRTSCGRCAGANRTKLGLKDSYHCHQHTHGSSANRTKLGLKGVYPMVVMSPYLRANRTKLGLKAESSGHDGASVLGRQSNQAGIERGLTSEMAGLCCRAPIEPSWD